MFQEIHKSFRELRDVMSQVVRYSNMKTSMKANKNALTLGLSALALLAVLLGAWSFMDAPVAPVAGMATTTTPGAEAETPSATGATKPVASGGKTAPKPPAPKAKFAGVGSFGYLVGLKQTLTCNIETTSSLPDRVGTVFISGDKLRGDFSSYFNGATRTSHMVIDGVSLYVWVNGYDSGLKLPAANGASGSAAANAGGVDPNVNVAFACYPWTPEGDSFALPSDVAFTDSFGH
jgi:hypothetical protein